MRHALNRWTKGGMKTECKLAGAEVQEKGDWSADASMLNKDVHMVTRARCITGKEDLSVNVSRECVPQDRQPYLSNCTAAGRGGFSSWAHSATFFIQHNNMLTTMTAHQTMTRHTLACTTQWSHRPGT
jgi:hypothetical protein